MPALSFLQFLIKYPSCDLANKLMFSGFYKQKCYYHSALYNGCVIAPEAPSLGLHHFPKCGAVVGSRDFGCFTAISSVGSALPAPQLFPLLCSSLSTAPEGTSCPPELCCPEPRTGGGYHHHMLPVVSGNGGKVVVLPGTTQGRQEELLYNSNNSNTPSQFRKGNYGLLGSHKLTLLQLPPRPLGWQKNSQGRGSTIQFEMWGHGFRGDVNLSTAKYRGLCLLNWGKGSWHGRGWS